MNFDEAAFDLTGQVGLSSFELHPQRQERQDRNDKKEHETTGARQEGEKERKRQWTHFQLQNDPSLYLLQVFCPHVGSAVPNMPTTEKSWHTTYVSYGWYTISALMEYQVDNSFRP